MSVYILLRPQQSFCSLSFFLFIYMNSIFLPRPHRFSNRKKIPCILIHQYMANIRALKLFLSTTNRTLIPHYLYIYIYIRVDAQAALARPIENRSSTGPFLLPPMLLPPCDANITIFYSYTPFPRTCVQ